jgi:ABC-type nitrate/sulfonate/bicarbonate transport system permease component
MTAIAAARRTARRTTMISGLSLALGVCLWQLMASGISDLILPPPTDVLARLMDPAFFARLSRALGQSLVPLALGFAISLGVAVPLGIAIGRSKSLSRMFEPVITAIYAIPPIAFVPFLVVWFGLFFPARVALVVLMTVFDVLQVIIAGARDVRPGLLDVGRSFGASRLARTRLIVLPALSPFLFAGLRVGFARAVNGTITAELFFAAVNLGAIMKRATENFDTAGVLLVVLLVCLLGLLGQAIITLLETRLLHWHVRS